MVGMKNLEILSIIIFGSSARGENDAYSDLDVCVITLNTLNASESNILKKHVSDKYNLSSEDITIYTSNQIESMIEYGSLFLWHIKLEGKILYDDGYFKETIIKLPRYDKHLSELYYHAELIDDVAISLERFSMVNELDLSQIFTVCRNTCMILAHLNKEYAFGRNSAFLAASRIYSDLPLTQHEYTDLSKWKLRYERGLYYDIKLPSLEDMSTTIKRTRKLLYYAIEKVSNV